MRPSYRKVLTVLADTPDQAVSPSKLPDGNGRIGCATGVKLKEMGELGWIVYVDRPRGWKITPAGLAALAHFQKDT